MRRWFALFLLFLPLSLLGESGAKEQAAPQQESREGRPNPATGSINPQPTAPANENQFNHQPPKCPLPALTDPFWSNWALVLVGIAAAWIALGTLDDIKRQGNLTEKTLYLSHRPRIIVRSVVIKGLTKLNRQTPMNEMSVVLNGYYVVANVGGLAATVEHLREGTWCGNGIPMERPDRDYPGRVVNLTLTPGESKEILFRDIVLSSEDACKLVDTEIDVFFIAQLDYIDEGGIKRQTSICRKYDHRTQRFVRIDDVDYEYAD